MAADGRCEVVLCDDTDDVRMLLRIILEAHDSFCVVGEARNGREAIDAVSELQPDVLLLDVSMPVMDGLEAIPHVREASPETKIVMLSAFAARELASRAEQLGAHLYLEKGVIDPQRLPRELQRVCKDPDS